MNPKSPIGIFDSGVGGLTIAHSVIRELPHEDVIYFGDTANLPYGPKTENEVKHYASRIAQFLLDKSCKLILIACNTASCIAYHPIQQQAQGRAIVLNVINPVVNYLSRQTQYAHIGLIGTQRTIHSGMYQSLLIDARPDVTLQSLVTPGLAQAIEQYSHQPELIEPHIRTHLCNPQLKDIQALILGCTHYPIVKDIFASCSPYPIDLIDTCDLIGASVKSALKQSNLLNPNGLGEKRFYVSKLTPTFKQKAEHFFSEAITLLESNAQ